jgi:hypothetical protein
MGPHEAEALLILARESHQSHISSELKICSVHPPSILLDSYRSKG